MADEYIREAFHRVCKEAKEAKGYYVTLMVNVPYYGGPEEGGWWSSDQLVVAYQHFDTEEQATAAHVSILEMAEELSADARDAHNRMCADSMDWLDARGLDADFLPEVDGPAEYYVVVSEGLPTSSRGLTHFE